MRDKRFITTLTFYTIVALILPCLNCGQHKHIPEALETITAKDGTVWERVSEPGFGNDENIAAVAMQEYQGRLYTMVRNDDKGVELWRTAGCGWEHVSFENEATNGIYNNPWINTHMGAMIVFKGKLYLGFSSGIQGSLLKSSGCEVWRYDGRVWEPVITDKKDSEEAGTITAITECEDDDEDITALITDASKTWESDQWAGGILQITSGDGIYRRFDIESNTNDTLTIQQNEIAGNMGMEYTICESKHYVNPFPPHEYDLGKLEVGDSYEIGTGNDENGFGDYFNKCITTMAIFDNKLYVNTTLNYDYGGQVWYTEDGDNWMVTEPSNSLGIFHTDDNYPNSKKPVTRGIPSICPCSLSGFDVLYAGSLGSDGNLGSCARMAKLTAAGWELIVDQSVDDDDTGTNENGFGDGMDCDMFNGNFMVWSLACFNNKLFAGIQSLAGARVLYTQNGNSEDGNWFFSVGGDSTLPNGFDGVTNEGASDFLGETIFQNLAVNLFPFKDYLYAGLTCLYMPAYGATEESLTGSQIWKTRDGLAWDQVTDNGFGEIKVLNFEAFTDFNDTLYLSASMASNTVGGGLGGATIFRLVQQ